MGGKINRGIFADHEGKRVYFCCDGCPAAFKKDPEKYIKKLESDGVTLAKLQTNCPIEGDKIDRKVFADHHGKRVYFCCAGCPARFREDPAKYIKMLESKGIALEAPPHTKPLHKAKDHPH
ncbi:MAG: YHS domain-containing protein [Planctomycetes bacterium]|nr:YHS domain-containing protein [Planctomycetota bacterium]